jgi:photosystem II stability/assembly factor-like uncharacterized protein
MSTLVENIKLRGFFGLVLSFGIFVVTILLATNLHTPNSNVITTTTKLKNIIQMEPMLAKAQISSNPNSIFKPTIRQMNSVLTWSVVDSPTNLSLMSIDMVGPNVGWAVGAQGTILYWDGVSWEIVDSPTNQFLISVAMHDIAHGWAVGYSGTILHWDGENWETTPSPTALNLREVDVLSPTDAWAVGAQGMILHWDGFSWEVIESPTSESLGDIAMVDSDSGWAVGGSGTIIFWDGSSWELYPSPTSIALITVDITPGTAGEEAWAMGGDMFDGVVLRMQDGEWSIFPIVPPGGHQDAGVSVSMISSTDGWAVIRDFEYLFPGSFIHWNGTTWQFVSYPVTQYFSAVDMISSTDGWAVGDNGAILRYSDGFYCSDVTEIPTHECEALKALYYSTNGTAWDTQNEWLETTTPCSWYGVTCDAGSVTGINLSSNHLAGTIPVELGDLTNLVGLNLSVNQLAGPIPGALGGLSNLNSLYLHMNRLSGSFPSELGDLSSLSNLLVTYNHLVGEIPANIINLPGLSLIDINYNALSTTDPAVAAFFDTMNPGWADTQTVAPNNLLGIPKSTTEVELTWTPITYTVGSGYYEVSYAENEAGEFVVAGVTDDKSSDSMVVTGLAPGQAYYFRVRTLTAQDWLGPTELWSEYSPTVSVYTALAETEITPVDGGELTFGFGDGGLVTVQVPVGAVNETIVLLATVNLDAVIPPDANLVGASFNIVAYLDGIPLGSYDFLQPVLIRIDYTDTQVAGLDEGSLRLYIWDDAMEIWLDAAQTCDPVQEYTRNPGENWFSFYICHLSQFAVFGEIEPESFTIFLPTLRK